MNIQSAIVFQQIASPETLSGLVDTVKIMKRKKSIKCLQPTAF